MAREYPRFLYSNPQNTKSKGPFIVHLLKPRMICKVYNRRLHSYKADEHFNTLHFGDFAFQILESWDETQEAWTVLNDMNTWLQKQIASGEIILENSQKSFVDEKAARINYLLSKFKEWDFKETKDADGSFATGSKLFYKSLGEQYFLIFNHWNWKKIESSGFDLWLAKYSDEQQIGQLPPIEYSSLKISFNIEKDYGIIKPYVPS